MASWFFLCLVFIATICIISSIGIELESFLLDFSSFGLQFELHSIDVISNRNHFRKRLFSLRQVAFIANVHKIRKATEKSPVLHVLSSIANCSQRQLVNEKSELFSEFDVWLIEINTVDIREACEKISSANLDSNVFIFTSQFKVYECWHLYESGEYFIHTYGNWSSEYGMKLSSSENKYERRFERRHFTHHQR